LDIDSFDQWGVELGNSWPSALRRNDRAADDKGKLDHDSSTNGLIRPYR